jgi:hypothetical protein
MDNLQGYNLTGQILVWKVLPTTGRAFWVKVNPMSMSRLPITKAKADQLIAAGATKLDDHKIVKSGREVTINF